MLPPHGDMKLWDNRTLFLYSIAYYIIEPTVVTIGAVTIALSDQAQETCVSAKWIQSVKS